jgi:hypothetical protein
MKRTVLWHPANQIEAIKCPATLPEVVDGIFAYRVTASDERTWLDLHVRVKPDRTRIPEAYDIGLHTRFPGDLDRWQDFTSSLSGAQYVGYIVELMDPHPRFWQELETQFLELDAKARADYARDMEVGPPSKAEVAMRAALEAARTSPLEFANGFRINGRNGNLVVLEAATIEAAIAKYRAWVDSTVAKLDAGGAVKPNYDIELINDVGPITIIR